MLLFSLNNAAANTRRQVIGLGVLHTATTVFTHYLYGWLYFHYIHDDVVGRALLFRVVVIAAGITVILGILSM